MQRALTWLNLYGCESVWHKSKNSLKHQKSICWTASRPYRLSHINALYINSEIFRKNIENWLSPENDFCLVFNFLVFGYWVVKKSFFLNEKYQGGSYDMN